jgi:hypothetical protein
MTEVRLGVALALPLEVLVGEATSEVVLVGEDTTETLAREEAVNGLVEEADALAGVPEGWLAEPLGVELALAHALDEGGALGDILEGVAMSVMVSVGVAGKEKEVTGDA